MRAFFAWLTVDPKPDGKILKIARWTWVVLVAAASVLFVASLGPTWREATGLGTFVEYFGAPGHYRLTPRQLSALSDIGLTESWHGALVLTRQIVLFSGSVLVAWIVWRSNRGWASVFVSWFLVSMLPIASAEVLGNDGTSNLGFPLMVFFFTSFVGMLFVLPDGRRIRLFALTVLAWTITFAVGTRFYGDDTLWVVGSVALLASIVLGAVVAISQAIRTRDPARRAVLGLAAVFTVMFLPLMFFSDELSGVTRSGRAGGQLVQRIIAESVFFSLPLIFGVGLVYLIVKRGLWDLDIAINRTVVYGILTTVLFAGYFVLVAVVQAISSETFGIRDNTLALVVATATGAAAFLPLRARLQRGVDRIFFRKRYDLERTVERLDDQIRSRERIDAIGGDLVAAVDEAFRPSAAELWLPVSGAEARR